MNQNTESVQTISRTRGICFGLLVVSSLVLALVLMWLWQASLASSDSKTSSHRGKVSGSTSCKDIPKRQSEDQHCPETTGGAAHTLGFKPGDRLTYSVQKDQTIALIVEAGTQNNGAGSVSQPNDIKVSHRGNLHVEVFSLIGSNKEHHAWLIGFSVSNWKTDVFTGGALGEALDFPALNDMTGSSVLAIVEDSGRITKMVPQSAFSPEAKTMWKDLLAGWQVVLPQDRAKASWTNMESDVTGTYLAAYKKEAAKVMKNKLRYVKLSSSGTQTHLNTQSDLNSIIEVTLDPYQIAICGVESLRLAGPGGTTAASSVKYSYQLIAASQSQSVLADAAQQARIMATSTNNLEWLSEGASFNEPQIAYTPEEIEQMLDTLNAVCNSDQAHSSQHVELASELIAAIKSGDPTAVGKIMDNLSRETMSNEHVATLMGILGAAGTQEAQEALLAMIASEEWPGDLRDMALQALVQVSEPIAEVDGTLSKLANRDDEYAKQAILVLAAMADKLNTGEASRSQVITQQILDMLGSTLPDNKEEAVWTLAVIGNLGLGEVPVLTIEALNAPNAEIREHAIQSLERVNTATADSLIAKAVTDPDEDVRLAAIKLLGSETRREGLGLLLGVMATDVSDNARSAAVMSLTNWLQDGSDTGLAVLANLADNDSSEHVRETAASQFEFLTNKGPGLNNNTP